MSREDAQMKIRLPADLRDKIAASAADYGRSLNAEIVARLEVSFDMQLMAPQQINILQEVIDRLDRIQASVGDPVAEAARAYLARVSENERSKLVAINEIADQISAEYPDLDEGDLHGLATQMYARLAASGGENQASSKGRMLPLPKKTPLKLDPK